MSHWEASIVTVLGMAVVFLGLVLCIAFIQLFNRLARHVSWGEGPHGQPVAAPAEVPSPAEQPPISVEPVPADILAVIAAVLEIERKLYLPRPGSRMTIRRSTSKS